MCNTFELTELGSLYLHLPSVCEAILLWNTGPPSVSPNPIKKL